jgi:AcrR family transcriptional regulator
MTKKELLMLTARRLFAENGFYGTPTARIAKEAEVSNGILFHYFPTKEKLIRAMYIDVKDRIFEYSLGQVYKGATLKESIYTLWLAVVEWYMEHPEDFHFMRQYESSPYYSVDSEMEHRHTQLTLELISEGMEQGIFKTFSAHLLFQIMMKLVQNAVEYIGQHEVLREDFEFRYRLFDVTWDALRKTN